jgi:hypothetical protein
MSGRQVVLAAFLLHACGFFFGYLLSRMLGLDVASSRTISIEVGMQVDNYSSWIIKGCFSPVLYLMTHMLHFTVHGSNHIVVCRFQFQAKFTVVLLWPPAVNGTLVILGADPWIDALMGPEFYIWHGGAKYV